MGQIENIFGLGVGGLVALKTIDVMGSVIRKPRKKKKKKKKG